ncbi:DNA methyltransferase family protein [Stetteria hydrogenophila]
MSWVPEYVVNVRLADVLSREFGIDARAERLSGRRRPDIRCYYRGLIIGIEASYDRSDAERDAEKRLEEGLVDVAIALWLKERYRDEPEPQLVERIRRSRFDVKVLVPVGAKDTLISFLERSTGRRVEATGWFRDVDLPLLKTIIESASSFLAREEEVQGLIAEVKREVEDFTRALASVDGRGEIRRGIYDQLYRLYGLSVAEAEDPEIAFGQAVLSILLSTVFYERVRSVHPRLEPVRRYVDRHGPISGLIEAFRNLLKIDYRVAVETTLNILGLLPDSVAHRVRRLVDLALRIAQSPSLLRRDFAGRIYHEITGDIALRKGFATFYTEVPAAYLLATLAAYSLLGLEGRSIPRLGRGEAQEILGRIRSARVADLACGSGTLLTAAYSSLMRIASMLKYYHNLDVDLDEIGKTLIEEGIYGIDALRYASQITAINLALVGPKTITRENVYTIYLGYMPDKKTAWLGSLELLNDSGRVGGILAYIEGGLAGAAEKTTLEGVEGEVKIPGKFDLIIMNPPFTRATGRTERFEGGRGLFGFIVDEAVRQRFIKAYGRVRDKVKEELREIARANITLFPGEIQEIIRGAQEFRPYLDVGQAGEGLLFLYLAYKYVGDDGVIAFVLPRNILAGASWFLARTLLATKFHVLYVVVSSDSRKGYNFSEGTSLSEALIIARRKTRHEPGEETVFVNLLSKPSGMLEAVMLGTRISEGRFAEGHGLVEELGSAARVRVVSREELLKHVDNWNMFVALPDQELVDAILDLIDNGAVNIGGHRVRIPLARFNELIHRLGIDAHQFHDHFRRTSTATPYPVIYGGGEEVRRKMAAEPNAYAEPRTSRARELYGEFSGRIIVPDRIWWDTAHAIAMLSKEPVLSNTFYAVRLNVPEERREQAEKALVLWLNTTWGLLTILANREETRGRWSRLKMTHWRMLPVLDVRALPGETLKELARAFDEYAEKEMKRIPEQFNPGKPDPVRLGVDTGFLRALNPQLRDEAVKDYLLDLYKRVDSALKQWIK